MSPHPFNTPRHRRILPVVAAEVIRGAEADIPPVVAVDIRVAAAGTPAVEDIQVALKNKS